MYKKNYGEYTNWRKMMEKRESVRDEERGEATYKSTKEGRERRREVVMERQIKESVKGRTGIREKRENQGGKRTIVAVLINTLQGTYSAVTCSG